MIRPQVYADPAEQEQAIREFFAMAEDRVQFIDDLLESGRYPEALILCLTYVDSFATWLYWPRPGVGRNFVEALGDHEPEPFLALLHPLQLVRSLARLREPWKQTAARIEALFPGPDYELLERDDFLASLVGHIPPEEIAPLQEELWRGTVAHIAYEHLRNPSVHGFVENWSVLFDRTTLKGAWAGVFGIDRLMPPLRAMLGKAKEKSFSTGEWFGNNAIVDAT